MSDKRCVHTEHCCAEHGCKYMEENCPVVLGVKPQSFPCEDCNADNLTSTYFTVESFDIEAIQWLVKEVNNGEVFDGMDNYGHPYQSASLHNAIGAIQDLLTKLVRD